MPVIITEVAIQSDGTFAVELYNNGSTDVDISGVELSAQLPAAFSIASIEFDPGTEIEAGQTLTIGHSSIPDLDLTPSDPLFDQTFSTSAAPSLSLVYLGDNADPSTATDSFGVLNGPPFSVDTTYEGPIDRTPDTDVNTDNTGDFTETADFHNNTLGIPCFLAGTLIATPGGERRVEDLVAGDRVCAADGRTVAVTWVGQRRVKLRIGGAVDADRAVCIAAGALGNHSDLYVTADHGMIVDGTIIDAGALVNGDTIAWVPYTGPYMVYHVETARHEVLLANGARAESFVDVQGAKGFDAGDARPARIIPVMDMPRISSVRLARAKLA